MSYEVNWLRQRVDELRSAVQQARWHVGEVGDCRTDLSAVWNDRCAVEIGRRYLDPWSGEAASALDALHAQNEALYAGTRALEEGENFAAQADRLSREVQRLASELNTLLHGMDSVIQEARNRAAESSSQTNAAHSWLAQAEAAGHSA